MKIYTTDMDVNMYETEKWNRLIWWMIYLVPMLSVQWEIALMKGVKSKIKFNFCVWIFFYHTDIFVAFFSSTVTIWNITVFYFILIFCFFPILCLFGLNRCANEDSNYYSLHWTSKDMYYKHNYGHWIGKTHRQNINALSKSISAH
jgi:hypothetical protein